MSKKLKDFTLWPLFMEFNCLKAAEPLLGDRFLFTTKSPGVPGTHFKWYAILESAFSFYFSKYSFKHCDKFLNLYLFPEAAISGVL